MGTPLQNAAPGQDAQEPAPEFAAPLEVAQPLSPWRITPEPGTALADLCDQRELLLAQAEDAKKRAESLVAKIKAITIPMAPPGTTSIIITGTPYRPELVNHWVESWRFDTKRFKRDHLVQWVKYAIKGGTWKLEKTR
jgi:hypothetical protein